ncbi:protein unc-50 homolog [Lytechinus variegatus]|uniref:protein unc-50 homolog n=1 Tax=Lytechinus variegatus TaxID=7654 RepID=UPI001BB21D17|nr:protein unc-50 homolog [Lytechinus variegatus]
MLSSVITTHSPHSSPPTSPTGIGPTSPRNEARMTAQAKRHKYLRRILRFRQMDFEFAMWQMIYLLVAPQKVYRNFQYRKQTKNQFARDDPAFLVLLSVCLCASSVGFAFVLDLHFVGFLKFLLWVVCIDCIGVGLCIATALWFITNRYLLISHRGQDVEWGYAFDVHLNAFFPILIILHVFQLILYMPIINRDSFLSTFFGDTLWVIAIGYYIYITFLGYSALPFLKRTVVLLYPPCVTLFCLYILSVTLNWNISRTVMHFYRYRVK